jgi:hypothetical protein
VFGLAGYVLPHSQVRHFATFFYQLKNNLLQADLQRCAAHPATWEKKGSELISTKNIKRYRSVRSAIHRVLNEINKCNGKIIYYGREKYMDAAKSNSQGLYKTVLSHKIRSVDTYATHINAHFLMILDQHQDRIKLLEAASKTMFGEEPARRLMEPPFQVESHLYQTVQAADWIAALIGRIEAHRVAPQQYADWAWAEEHFGAKVRALSTHSSLWRPANAQRSLALVSSAAPQC